jgi:hypothetical protein
MTEGHVTVEPVKSATAAEIPLDYASHARRRADLVLAITGTCICLWCSQPFEPRRSGGKPQRFCVPAHRRAFETASRRYLGRLIAAGDLSVAALSAAPATRALLPGAVPGGGVTTLAKTVRSRCTSPICVLWSGYDEKAGEPAPRTPEPVLGTEDSVV